MSEFSKAFMKALGFEDYSDEAVAGRSDTPQGREFVLGIGHTSLENSYRTYFGRFQIEDEYPRYGWAFVQKLTKIQLARSEALLALAQGEQFSKEKLKKFYVLVGQSRELHQEAMKRG